MKGPVLLPVLYVKIVVYLQHISQLGLQKKKRQNPKNLNQSFLCTINSFSVSRKSL